MTTGRAANSLLTVERFLQQVQGSHQKSAGTYEPGSIGGETKHITKNVDSDTYPLQEGEHSETNNKEVKEQVGEAAIVGEGKKKEAIDSIPTPGLNEAISGEDPENEKPKKTTKDDNAGQRLGRTTHAARADNPGLDKIAFDELSLDEHVKVASDLGNRVLAFLSVDTQEEAPSKQAETAKVDAAAQAGWEMAGLAETGYDKQAEAQFVVSTVQDIMKTASTDADNVAEFMASYRESARQAELQKRASVKAVRQKLAMAMPPGAGGPPPPEAAGGMPPEAMGGEGGEGGEGGGDDAELMAALEQFAQEQGMSVEDLISALLQGEGGGEAAGGAPPEAGPGPDAGMEVAANAKTAAAKPAAKKAGETKAAETTRAYIQELLNRSKA